LFIGTVSVPIVVHVVPFADQEAVIVPARRSTRSHTGAEPASAVVVVAPPVVLRRLKETPSERDTITAACFDPAANPWRIMTAACALSAVSGRPSTRAITVTSPAMRR
jgi:hypothetical protein